MKWTSRIAFVLIAGTALAADWPQLLGPARNGTSAETGLIDTFGKKGPALAWTRDVGEGYASPVIVGQQVLLFHRVNNEDILECLAARNGKLDWKYTYATDYEDALRKGDGPRATPVVAGDKVIVLGAGGQLHCVDLKTGKKVWAKDLHKEYRVPNSFFGVGTTPIVEGDNVLINVGGEGAGIVAFDLASGKEVWKATEQNASYSSPIAATIDEVRHVFFFTREGLVSIDPKSGKPRFTKRWRARINESVNAAMPVLVGDDHVFLTSSYQAGAILLKVKKNSVEEVWKGDKSLSSHYSTPVLVGEQLYGFDGRQEVGASLRCIDAKTGKVRWTEAGFGCGSLLYADKKLFVLSESGELVIVEPSGEKYVEKARAAVLGKPCRAHLALGNGLLCARDDKRLVCWKVKK